MPSSGVKQVRRWVTGVVFLMVLAIGGIAGLGWWKQAAIEKITEAIQHRFRDKVQFSSIQLSFWERFPFPALQVSDLCVLNRGDTLFLAKGVVLSIDFWDIIADDKFHIAGIDLYQPRMVWQTTDKLDSVFLFQFQLPEIQISHTPLVRIFGGDLVYIDPIQKLSNRLEGVVAAGELHYEAALTTCKWQGNIQVSKLHWYDNTISWLNYQPRSLEFDGVMRYDIANGRWMLDNTECRINALRFGCLGSVQRLAARGVMLDLNCTAPPADLQGLLSVLPFIPADWLVGMETSGTAALEVQLKGHWTNNQWPEYRIGVNIVSGSVRFAQMPQQISNVEVEAEISADQRQIPQIAIRKCHAKFGNHPVEIMAMIQGYQTRQVDLRVNSRIDFQHLMQVLPLKEYALKGLLDCNMRARGTYGNASMPVMTSNVVLKYAGVSKQGLGAQLENVSFEFSLVNNNGTLEDTRLVINNLHIKLGEQTLEGYLRIFDARQLYFESALQGEMELGLLGQLLGVEQAQGKLKIKAQSEGNFSDLINNRVEVFPTEGELVLTHFRWPTTEKPWTIETAVVKLSPDWLAIKQLAIQRGDSRLTLRGGVYQFWKYLAGKGSLNGNLYLSADSLRPGEWLESTHGWDIRAASQPTVEWPVFGKGLHFFIEGEIQKLRIDDRTLTDLRMQAEIMPAGKLRIRQLSSGIGKAGKLSIFDGFYQPVDSLTGRPQLTLNLQLKNLRMAEMIAFAGKLAPLLPAAHYATGQADLDGQFSGLLTAEPGLDWQEIFGMLSCNTFSLNTFPVLTRLQEQFKLPEFNRLKTTELRLPFEYRQGVLKTLPTQIEIKADEYMYWSGDQLDNRRMDYVLLFNFPLSKLSNTQLTQLLPLGVKDGYRLRMAFQLKGEFEQPVLFNLLQNSDSTITEQQKEAHHRRQWDELKITTSWRFKEMEEQRKKWGQAAADFRKLRLQAENEAQKRLHVNRPTP